MATSSCRPSRPISLGRFRTAFFDSAFTHNSQGGQLTVHPGGYIGLLEALAKRKTKPDTTFWVSTSSAPSNKSKAKSSASNENNTHQTRSRRKTDHAIRHPRME